MRNNCQLEYAFSLTRQRNERRARLRMEAWEETLRRSFMPAGMEDDEDAWQILKILYGIICTAGFYINQMINIELTENNFDRES